MSSEMNDSFEFDQSPADYFTHLLAEKSELHETLLRKAVSEDVWVRQREIEELTVSSYNIDSKGFVDVIAAGVQGDVEMPDTPEQAERDNFIDIEEGLIAIERSYLNGFTIMTDEASPYLVKRDNPQILFDPSTLKPSVVRFIEFIAAQDGMLQREWYRSVAGNLDLSLSLLARERQKAEGAEDTEINRTALEADRTTLLFTALENLNFKFCQMLELSREQLLRELRDQE